MTLLDGEYHLITVQEGKNIYIVQEQLSTPLKQQLFVFNPDPIHVTTLFKAKQSKVLDNYAEEVISSRIIEYYTPDAAAMADDIELATPPHHYHDNNFSNSSVFISKNG